MKPHIRKINKIWRCSLSGHYGCGLGFTPAEAYKDWSVMWAAV